jgi:ribosomal-protein-alanine N-acetyltransferase
MADLRRSSLLAVRQARAIGRNCLTGRPSSLLLAKGTSISHWPAGPAFVSARVGVLCATLGDKSVPTPGFSPSVAATRIGRGQGTRGLVVGSRFEWATQLPGHRHQSAAVASHAVAAQTRCTRDSAWMNALISVPTIAGSGLRLRPWVLADAACLKSACGDPDICRFTTVPHHYTQESAAAWIRRQLQRTAAGAGIVLAIEPAAAGRPVGMVGLFGLDEPSAAARFGYWIMREHRGTGLASKAVRLVADWAFSHLDIDVIHVDVEPQNTASLRVAQAVGATHEQQLTRQLRGETVNLERFALRR